MTISKLFWTKTYVQKEKLVADTMDLENKDNSSTHFWYYLLTAFFAVGN